jgi:transcriptional regulator with XRE-family HTH domain
MAPLYIGEDILTHLGRQGHRARPDGLRCACYPPLENLRRVSPLRPPRSATILSRIPMADSPGADRIPTERRFRQAIGEALRATRRQQGLTLRDVADLSGRRFKPSALGGYERGERAISLERFWELAGVYGVPADRLLGDVLDRIDPEGRVEVLVDLSQLELIPGDEPRIAAELVERVVRLRGERLGGAVALRAGDLEEMALASRMTPAELVRRLEPAVRTRDTRRLE